MCVNFFAILTLLHGCAILSIAKELVATNRGTYANEQADALLETNADGLLQTSEVYFTIAGFWDLTKRWMKEENRKTPKEISQFIFNFLTQR